MVLPCLRSMLRPLHRPWRCCWPARCWLRRSPRASSPHPNRQPPCRPVQNLARAFSASREAAPASRSAGSSVARSGSVIAAARCLPPLPYPVGQPASSPPLAPISGWKPCHPRPMAHSAPWSKSEACTQAEGTDGNHAHTPPPLRQRIIPDHDGKRSGRHERPPKARANEPAVAASMMIRKAGGHSGVNAPEA